jgi:hypothetical protein
MPIPNGSAGEGAAAAVMTKARVWRDRAARYRALARASFNNDSRTTFLKLADDCERYAEKAEARANLE